MIARAPPRARPNEHPSQEGPLTEDPAETEPRADPPPAPGPPPPESPKPARRRAWRGMARGFLSVGVTVALVAVVALGRGGLVPHSQPPPRTPVAVPPPPSALPGLQATPGPWPAEYRHLAARMAALGLPDLSDTVFHVHAMLRVFVDGRKVVVPADIGLPGQGGVFSPLHTHDTSGIIHIESARPYAFSLGQFFDVWGVVFTATQLGSLHSAGARTLQVYVNGRPVADGPAYRMQVHDNIVVAFGRAGSFPTNPPADFSGGL